MSQPEPEWDEETRALAVAYIEHTGQLHQSCGVPLERGMDPNQAWRVHQLTCHACRAKKTIQDQYHRSHKDSKGRSDEHEFLWQVEPIPTPAPLTSE